MTLLFLPVLVLALQGAFIPASSTERVIYCAKPTTDASCPGDDCQQCETIQYYFDNANRTINQQNNVTMILMTGTHSYTISNEQINITAPILHLRGERQNVTLSMCCDTIGQCGINISSTDVSIENLELMNFTLTINTTSHEPSMLRIFSVKLAQSTLAVTSVDAYIERTDMMETYFAFYLTTNIKFTMLKFQDSIVISLSTRGILRDCMFQESMILIRYSHLQFEECIFQDSTAPLDIYSMSNVTLGNCYAYNSPIIVRESTTISFTGTSEFAGSNQALALISSVFNMSGNVTFVNNTGTRGAAMILYSSTLNIAPNTNLVFINNSAKDRGGAIYIEPGVSSIFHQFHFICFFQLLNCSNNANYSLYFSNNSAVNGGDDVYGAFLQAGSGCLPEPDCNLIVNITNPSKSSVSSNPLHVCTCDNDGKPHCSISLHTLQAFPGETFTVSAVVVGGDDGVTVGAVYAEFLPTDWISSEQPSSQNIQSINTISNCVELTYTLYPQKGVPYVLMYLTTSYANNTAVYSYSCSDEEHCDLLDPIVFNITIIPCPSGFIHLKEPNECKCHPTLTRLNIECHSRNEIVAFSWAGAVWVNISDDIIVYNYNCPLHYCDETWKQVNILNDSDTQCAFNRAGRLCGGCKDNYSLAIGSSLCIHCPNNNNVALLIFFAAAGFLLVFFISAFNLTVTNGMINGLIFYANIVWTYQSIFFPQDLKTNSVLKFLKVFIAWINLDFGIETCFVNGLTAFWKTWLQFIFPLYLWAIAGLIIVIAKYSSRLTALLGNRAVPVLNTLILLSYMKMLRLVVSILEFSVLNYDRYLNHTTTLAVWSVDGNLAYFEYPHILLFLAGLVTVLFLWLPYTVLLFLMQWLRRLPQSRILKWVMKFHPVYDAYFAPLKHKQQYWFGVLLLARGILLVTFASSFAVPHNINLLVLLVFAILLLFYMTLVHPYRSKGVLILQSTFFINLALLSGFIFFTYTQHESQQSLQAIAIGISTGVAFLQFCGIVIYAVAVPRCFCQRKGNNLGHERAYHAMPKEQSHGYRDSILDESTQPLLHHT